MGLGPNHEKVGVARRFLARDTLSSLQFVVMRRSEKSNITPSK